MATGPQVSLETAMPPALGKEIVPEIFSVTKAREDEAL